jgi:hypothetical protein
LLAAGPWDVVVLDDAHEAHRSGSNLSGTPNKLLAVLQAMKSSHSMKAVYLASATPKRMRLNQALDLLDLLGLTKMRVDIADDLARHFAMPPAERRETDWAFIGRLCTRWFIDTGAEQQDKVSKPARLRPRRRSAAERVTTGMGQPPITEHVTRP